VDVGTPTLLVIAHLRKGETYTDLASGFGIVIRVVAAQEGCGAHASKTAGRRARLPIGTTRTGSSTAPG
jgi:hypothetical protein